MTDDDRARKWLKELWRTFNTSEAYTEMQEVASLVAEFSAVRADARNVALYFDDWEQGRTSAIQSIVSWLRKYADECSGSHPANSGHIALNAAASLIESGEWARKKKSK